MRILPDPYASHILLSSVYNCHVICAFCRVMQMLPDWEAVPQIAAIRYIGALIIIVAVQVLTCTFPKAVCMYVFTTHPCVQTLSPQPYCSFSQVRNDYIALWHFFDHPYFPWFCAHADLGWRHQTRAGVGSRRRLDTRTFAG